MTTIYEDYNFTLPAKTDDAPVFTVLEEGDYRFTVIKTEPGQFTPKETSKAPACRMVKVTVQIEHQGDKVQVIKDILLYSDLEFIIRSFFISIGMAERHGEVEVNWKKAIGRQGWAHVTKTAGKREGAWFNNVAKFLLEPPAESVVAAPPKTEDFDEVIPF